MDGWEWMDGLDSTSSVDEILGIYEWKGTRPLMDVTRSWARGVSVDDSVKGYVHNCMHVIVTWGDH
ncbi:hypothetical protein PRIPAC_92592 [Pristionchus pacificus]|uniref:Uncharacterized protein n=1 Tax=Pristionchus pacificus TaxID=54126 RepID=A0A2A6BP82_PRIPA|nr:hypothetical protein PRIPAC_92592 [Pristionchus pacificus]|eukprot:PDM67648.1 hypothetical protein PRIPAC_45692 [Pristionchus pacificus]